MKIEYRAYRELDGDLPTKVIEYAKDELRYKILTDNGLHKEILKEYDEMLAYFIPKRNHAESLLDTRVKKFITRWNGKKDYILMGIRSYQEIVMILEMRRKALLHIINNHENTTTN